MWHIKNAFIFYNEAKIITELRDKLLTCGGIKKDQKFNQADFFSLINSSMDKLW